MGTQEGALGFMGGPPGWKGTWQAAWLAVSILMFPTRMTQGLYSTTSMIFVTSQPPNPIQEGGNVTLTPHAPAKDFSRCTWYREETVGSKELILAHEKGQFSFFISGQAYTKRETIDYDCSLHIQSLVQEDDGVYTVDLDQAGKVFAVGYVILEVEGHKHSDTSSPHWQEGNMVEIVAGAIVAILAVAIVVGIASWICVRRLKSRRASAVVIIPSAPPPLPPYVPPPPPYEHIFPPGQAGPWVSPTTPPGNPYEVGGIGHPCHPMNN